PTIARTSVFGQCSSGISWRRLGDIQRRTLGKESAWHKFESSTVYGHDRPLFRSRNMREPHGIPDDDVLIFDGAIRLDPRRQTVVTATEENVATCRIHLSGIVPGDPEVSVDEPGPAGGGRS